MIAAGPFVNVVIAFVILFFLAMSLDEPTELAVGGDRARRAGRGPAPGRATESSPIDGVTTDAGSLDSQARS